MVESQVAEYAAKRGELIEARAQHGEELASALTETAKLRETLPLVDQQLEARRQLLEKGYFSRLKMLEYEQLRIERVKNIDIQMSNAAKARAAVAAIDSQLTELRRSPAQGQRRPTWPRPATSASLRDRGAAPSTQRKTFQALRCAGVRHGPAIGGHDRRRRPAGPGADGHRPRRQRLRGRGAHPQQGHRLHPAKVNLYE